MADEHEHDAPAGAAPADDAELAAALAETGYVYTDPVPDPTVRRITAADPEDPPDAFPEGWSSMPTERDQAAIDAGNA